MPKVTAIIPTTEWTKDYCKVAVESLRATTDWDIIVVSNGTPVAYPLEVKAHRMHTPDQGQCGAVNIGAQVANPTTEYFFILNDDMYFAPHWNRNLRFDHLCFSPNLVEPTNNNGSAPPFIKFDGGFTLDEFNREKVDEHVSTLTTDMGEPEHASAREDRYKTTGFNFPFFIKREVFQTIGGFDTAYDPWGSNSDTDFQTKVEVAGIKPQRIRDALVYHFSSKSGTFEMTPEKQELWWKNFNYYTKKFGFNRDELGSDTWMCENMIDWDKLIFKPHWMKKYE